MIYDSVLNGAYRYLRKRINESLEFTLVLSGLHSDLLVTGSCKDYRPEINGMDVLPIIDLFECFLQ